MTLWILTTLMTAVVAVVVAVPLIRKLDAPRAEKARIVDQSRAQLAEIEAQVAAGTVTEDEAAETRREVERRVLAAIKAQDSAPAVASDKSRLAALAILGGWIVVGGAGLYAVVGRPDLPGQPMTGLASAPLATTQAQADQPAATDMTAAAPAAGSVEEMIAGLITKLEANPDDAAGWQMLGWSYFNTERYAMAADAYGKAVALDGSNADVWSAYGETLVRSSNGLVTDLALSAFDSALAINPDDPRARFFKGMKLEQDGDPAAAVAAWLAIYDRAPAGADWLSGLVQRIQESAAANGIDLGDRLAGAPTEPPLSAASGTDLLPPASSQPGPTADDIAAAQQMSTEDQQAMIQGMVGRLAARLEENPDDPEGWVRLINSRMVLGDATAAQEAFSKAQEVFAAAPDKLNMVKAGAAQAGLSVN